MNRMITAGVVSMSIALTLLSNTTCAEPGEVKRQAALAAARDEALRLGYPVARMEVSADGSNSQWWLYLSRFVNTQPFPELRAKLRGHDYWAVHFSPHVQDPPRTGGDLWVFVDRDTGTIIDVLKGY